MVKKVERLINDGHLIFKVFFNITLQFWFNKL